MQRGRQTHVDQVDHRIVVDRVEFGGGVEAELAGELVQLGGRPAEHDDLVDTGMVPVDVGVGDAEAGAQQADLHGGNSLASGECRQGSARHDACRRA